MSKPSRYNFPARCQATTQAPHARLEGLPRRSERLAPDHLGRAIASYATGRSVESIASQLGISATTVRQTLINAGVELRRIFDHPVGAKKVDLGSRNTNRSFTLDAPLFRLMESGVPHAGQSPGAATEVM